MHQQRLTMPYICVHAIVCFVSVCLKVRVRVRAARLQKHIEGLFMHTWARVNTYCRSLPAVLTSPSSEAAYS